MKFTRSKSWDWWGPWYRHRDQLTKIWTPPHSTSCPQTIFSWSAWKKRWVCVFRTANDKCSRTNCKWSNRSCCSDVSPKRWKEGSFPDPAKTSCWTIAKSTGTLGQLCSGPKCRNTVNLLGMPLDDKILLLYRSLLTLSSNPWLFGWFLLRISSMIAAC